MYHFKNIACITEVQVSIVVDYLTNWISWACSSRPSNFVIMVKIFKRHIEVVPEIIRAEINSTDVRSLNSKMRTDLKTSYCFKAQKYSKIIGGQRTRSILSVRESRKGQSQAILPALSHTSVLIQFPHL